MIWWKVAVGLYALIAARMCESDDPQWIKRGFATLLVLIILTLLTMMHR